MNTSGLSVRHKWEVPLQNDALSVDTFVTNNAVEAASYVRPHAVALAPLFRIDFTRRLWRVGTEGGEIEIALNADAISIPDTQACEPTDELELEWRPANGSTFGKDAIIGHLHAWTQALRAVAPGLMSPDISKAQRDYQLRKKAAGGQT